MTLQGGMMMGVPPPPAPSSGGTIPLTLLIEYGLQRTYHELVVLSELLPRKTDMERKIEIFQFASRTRQLFVRLLAVVKWANSASKVDKCMDICNFLEQQSMYFVETADQLHKMAKETLASARLPSFSLPCAVDVLTTGTYPRLPTCIREKIIPPDPITPQEKAQTLQRLNEVIQYRLVSNELPKQMRRLKIDHGRVTLTLMGDSPTIPWRLLDVSFLVEDNETGHGKSLVHSMQVHYIHELAQSRLHHVDHPLHDLYKVLHSFCQSLQLEVLHSQAQRLMTDRLRDSIRIEEYSLSKSLSLSYWRDQLKKEKNQENFIIYKLSVHVCEEDDGKPLQISHQPPMTAAECRKVGLAIKSDHLSIEKLLMQTIEVRTHSKLKELARELQRLVDGKCEVRDMPVALHVCVLSPCMSSEVLRISIDVQTGSYMCSVPLSGPAERPAIQAIEDALNGEKRGVEKLLVKLKVQLILQRCEKCVQLMMSSCRHSLPIINMEGHALSKLAASKLFVRVPKQHGYYVVVEVREGEHRRVDINYYMLETTSCTADGRDYDLTEDTLVKAFMKAGQLTPIDTYSLAHGEFCKIFDGIPVTMDSLTRKRKIFLNEDLDEPETKKAKGSPYFVCGLAYLLARCEEKMPYVFLGEELSRRGINHDGGTLDGTGTCLSLGILYFPEILGLPEDVNDGLRRQLLKCQFRIQSRQSRVWIVEFVFNKSPLPSMHIKESGPSQRVCLVLEMNGENVKKTVSDLLDEWSAIAYLFGAVQRFAESYNDAGTNLSSMIEIQSYNYRKLTLAYGPNMCSLVNVRWKPATERFELSLGTQLPSATANPHIPMLLQLTEEFNLHGSLTQLSQVSVTQLSQVSVTQLSQVSVTQLSQVSQSLSTLTGQSHSTLTGQSVSLHSHRSVLLNSHRSVSLSPLSQVSLTQLSQVSLTQLSQVSVTPLSQASLTQLSQVSVTQLSQVSVTQLSQVSLTQLSQVSLTQFSQVSLSQVSVTQLSQTLHDTWSPMMSISKLPSAAVLGFYSARMQRHIQNFTVIPQSSSHVRIICRGSHCIDVHFRGNKTVAVRDGAYSLFDTSKPIEGLSPTPGLKAFLSMFVDEGVRLGIGRRQSSAADDNPPSPMGLDPSEMFLSQQQQQGSPAPSTSRGGQQNTNTGQQRQQQDGGFRFHSPMTPPSNPHTPASPGSARLPAGVNPSPSAALMGTPSPGTLLSATSPGNPQLHVPSPGSFVPAQSPQPSLVSLHMQSPAASFMPGLVEGGSPFPGSSLAMPSPGSARSGGGWVGSPQVQDPSSHHTQSSPGHPALHSPQTRQDSDLSRLGMVLPPSRVLPQRAWAAAVPTLLSHQGFNALLTPTPLTAQGSSVQPALASPLDRFFACTNMKRFMAFVVQEEPGITLVSLNDMGSLCFKVETLSFRVSLNSNTCQSLHVKITPNPESHDTWSAEEMQILEKFIDLKVFCPPYKLNSLTTIGRIISAPLKILKDCIQIMKLELMPDRSMKWTVQWCLTIPPSLNSISPVGVPAFVVRKKIIFMLQLTRIGLNVGPGEQSIVVPLMYELATNTLSRVEKANTQPSPAMQAVTTMLNRFAVHYQQNPVKECVILPAVKELLTNLVLPV
ncbi:mediator of RNA polymerase ii transcription subunit 14 [Plakobranchus ocellatus]|uniref:Mediator of RNA polymerase II transcription subunit 14 n=1 Tax=Plakobranchus ocellatus TaxID=259542 RepID=A0AAV4A5W5_9GAST|nr:mediator of RNA polymerase ii transcription subunit 14 [Plakobranchus ocellatus]